MCEKESRLTSGGALEVKRNFLGERSISRIVTIFLKKDDELVCLHNIHSYEDKSIKNLVSLRQVLPKMNLKLKDELSITDAYYLFDSLFKKRLFRRHECLYNNVPMDLKNFYLADLQFCDNVSIHTREEIVYSFPYIAERILLRKNAKFTGLGNSYIDEDDELKGFSDWCNYWQYNILGLEISDSKLYSVDSFQIYPSFESIKDMEYFKEQRNFYERKTSLEKALEEANIKVPKKELTIPEAIKLTRKIHKRK